jgi:hypothetical protein
MKMKKIAIIAPLGLLLILPSAAALISPAFASNSSLPGLITYYTANNGTSFFRSKTPFMSGVATQSIGSHGSVTVSANSSGYADSGFVIYDGRLGDINSVNVSGVGQQYSLNLWFDKDGDGEYFNWSGNVLSGLGSDSYILGPGSDAEGVLTIDDGSQFTSLNPGGGNYTFADLKAGAAPGITADTHVAIWIGVTIGSGGNTTATINSVSINSGTKLHAQLKATGDIWMANPSQQINFVAFDGVASAGGSQGTVEYWNYDYPGPLHYTANVLCAAVDPATENARFMFQIPAGWPGLTGLYVVSSVHDGGTPGTDGDTYGHAATGDLATAMQWCENGSGFSPTLYQIVAGNLVVHD